MKKLGVMILIKKDNQLLFLVRKKEHEAFHEQGIFIPIGGKVEKGESLEDCAIRETREESSLVINKLDLRGILYSRDISNDGFHDWVNYLFITEHYSGTPTTGNEGSFQWVKLNQISKINTYDGMKVFLNEVMVNNFIVMESEHQGFSLLSHNILYKA